MSTAVCVPVADAVKILDRAWGRPRQAVEAAVAVTPTVITPEVDAGAVLSSLEELGLISRPKPAPFAPWHYALRVVMSLGVGEACRTTCRTPAGHSKKRARRNNAGLVFPGPGWSRRGSCS